MEEGTAEGIKRNKVRKKKKNKIKDNLK
jgi:hypothetical protein